MPATWTHGAPVLTARAFTQPLPGPYRDARGAAPANPGAGLGPYPQPEHGHDDVDDPARASSGRVMAFEDVGASANIYGLFGAVDHIRIPRGCQTIIVAHMLDHRGHLGYPGAMVKLTSLLFSTVLVLVLGLGLGLACGSDGSQDTASCTVGSAGCKCTAGGGCDPGLTCASDTCVDLGGATDPSTSAVPTTGGTSEAGSGSDTQTATSAPTTGPGTSTGEPDATSTGGGPKLDVGPDTTTGLPVEGCTKIDMLFVLDGSGSMIEERGALSAVNAFTDIVDTLSELNGDIDYRIAVTTDNDDGYVNPNNCWDQPNKWIDSVGNTPAAVAKSFNCAVTGFGNNNFEADLGCEHVLTSAVDLLDGDASGFVRKDALLVLVMVTDVDDYGAYDQLGGNTCGVGCNTTPTPLAALYQRLIDNVKDGDPKGVAAIVVAGDPSVIAGMNFCGQPGSCGCAGFDCGVFHATRLYAFTQLLGANGFSADICGGPQAVPTAVKTALTESIDLACMKFDPPR